MSTPGQHPCCDEAAFRPHFFVGNRRKYAFNCNICGRCVTERVGFDLPRVKPAYTRGRPRLGKTHCRSPERMLARADARRKRHRHTKRSEEGVVSRSPKTVDDVVVYRTIPQGRYEYHRKRYEKAGRPWEDKPPREGWALRGARKLLPDVVTRAIFSIYENVKFELKKARKGRRDRTPRKRSRTQTIERLESELEKLQMSGTTAQYDAVNARLQEEYILRARRNFDEDPNRIWSDSFSASKHAEPFIVKKTKKGRHSKMPDHLW